MPIKRSNRSSVLSSFSSQSSDSVFVNPFKNPTLGTRTGLDVKAGKNIRRDENGFEVFDDYWSDVSELDDTCDQWLKEKQGKKAKSKATTKKAKAATAKPTVFKVDSPPRSISPFSSAGGGNTPLPKVFSAIGGSMTKTDRPSDECNSAMKSFDMKKRLTWSKGTEDEGFAEPSEHISQPGPSALPADADFEDETADGDGDDLDTTVTVESVTRSKLDPSPTRPTAAPALPAGIVKEGEGSGSITKGDKSGETSNSAMRGYQTHRRLTYSKASEVTPEPVSVPVQQKTSPEPEDGASNPEIEDSPEEENLDGTFVVVQNKNLLENTSSGGQPGLPAEQPPPKFMSLSSPNSKDDPETGGGDQLSEDGDGDIDSYQILSNDDVIHRQSVKSNRKRRSTTRKSDVSTTANNDGDNPLDATVIHNETKRGKKLATMSGRKRSLQQAVATKENRVDVEDVSPSKKSRKSVPKRPSVSPHSMQNDRAAAYAKLLEDPSPDEDGEEPEMFTRGLFVDTGNKSEDKAVHRAPSGGRARKLKTPSSGPVKRSVPRSRRVQGSVARGRTPTDVQQSSDQPLESPVNEASKVKSRKSVKFAKVQSPESNDDERLEKRVYRKTPAVNKTVKRSSVSPSPSKSPGRRQSVKFTMTASNSEEDHRSYHLTPVTRSSGKRRSLSPEFTQRGDDEDPSPELAEATPVRLASTPASAPRSILKKRTTRSRPSDMLIRDHTVHQTPQETNRLSSSAAADLTASSPKHFFEVTTSQTPVPITKPDTERKKCKIIYPSEAPDGVRRSQRTRVATLQWYKNERVHYDRRKSGVFVADVLSPTVTEDDIAWNKRKPKKGKRKTRKNPRMPSTPRNLSVHVMDSSDTEINDDPEICVINPDTGEEVYVMCMATKDSFNYRGPQGQPAQPTDHLVLCKGLQHPAFSVGQLILRPLAEKETQIVRNDSMAFTILRGKLAVTIHESTSILETDDVFFIPKGNTYSLKNLRNEDCKLCFFQLKG